MGERMNTMCVEHPKLQVPNLSQSTIVTMWQCDSEMRCIRKKRKERESMRKSCSKKLYVCMVYGIQLCPFSSIIFVYLLDRRMLCWNEWMRQHLRAKQTNIYLYIPYYVRCTLYAQANNKCIHLTLDCITIFTRNAATSR